ncbi:MAG: hypothetical protein SCH71_15215 [Desulfobulbaceae bacterium]|nr:hypothetical protein [Desulfobulbaceae bacterium]
MMSKKHRQSFIIAFAILSLLLLGNTWVQANDQLKPKALPGVISLLLSETNKHWTHPRSLSDNISPDEQNATNPQVAMDSNGNSIITWAQEVTSNFPKIFVSEYRNGAWTHPGNLNDYISPDEDLAFAYYPQVAMNDSGNAIIVWEQGGLPKYQIFKSEYRNGVWVHPSSFSDNISPDGQSAYDPQVATDNNDNAIIVWRQYDDGNVFQIFRSEYRNGAWTHPSGLSDNISPNGQNAYGRPQVAMDSNGNAIITWVQYDGSNWQIFKSEYRNGVWVHPGSLSDNISPDGQNAFDPQAAMDDNGNAIITWQQNDGSTDQIFKSEYRNGTWTHPGNLDDYINPDGEGAWNPQVAMDDNSNAIITWEQEVGGPDQIFKSEYRNGSWTHPASVDDYINPDGGDATQPQLAMDDNGSAIITWEQNDGNFYQIFKSEYRNGVWTHPASITDSISPDGEGVYWVNPQVAMDDNGSAIITWYQKDGNFYQIFKSEYR